MIMHGDGHGGVHHHDGLLNVNGIFENRFDIILTNPPFGARVEKSLKITEADRFTDQAQIAIYKERYGEAYTEALKQVNDHIGEPLLSLYKIDNGLTEVLFIERCLNLLKPGGRMGIVLPEGVLNNSNLQKVRDFVESKAKILFIVSIPQDVFMASGATVKPSLLFFKKFTEQERQEYDNILSNATRQIDAKYSDELASIETQLLKRGKDAVPKEEKKELKAKKKKIEEQKAIEIKTIVKEKFDYEIPIAEVQKAGISTTGAAIENELVPLAEEYTPYRVEKSMWEVPDRSTKYSLEADGNIYRIRMTGSIASEPEIFYGA
jgi:type I restriction enzyme M protein